MLVIRDNIQSLVMSMMMMTITLRGIMLPTVIMTMTMMMMMMMMMAVTMMMMMTMMMICCSDFDLSCATQVIFLLTIPAVDKTMIMIIISLESPHMI